MNEAFSAKITIIINKIVFLVAVNTYVPIFRGLDARGGRKLRTDTQYNLIIISDNNTRDNHMTIIIHYDSFKTSIYITVREII